MTRGAPPTTGGGQENRLFDERNRTFDNFTGDLTSHHRMPAEAILKTGAGMIKGGFAKDFNHVAGPNATKGVVLNTAFRLAVSATQGDLSRFYNNPDPQVQQQAAGNNQAATPPAAPATGTPAAEASAQAQSQFSSQQFANRADKLQAPFSNDMA
jgi:hypothetical protein